MPTNLTGEWYVGEKKVDSGYYTNKMSLYQSGTRLSGRFSSGGNFEGTVEGDTVKLSFITDYDFALYHVQLTIAADEQSMTGNLWIDPGSAHLRQPHTHSGPSYLERCRPAVEATTKERKFNNSPTSWAARNRSVVQLREDLIEHNLHVLLETFRILPPRLVHLVEDVHCHVQARAGRGLLHQRLHQLDAREDHPTTRGSDAGTADAQSGCTWRYTAGSAPPGSQFQSDRPAAAGPP